MIAIDNAKAFKKGVWYFDVKAITRMVVLSGDSLLSNYLHSELGQVCTKTQFEKACEGYRNKLERKKLASEYLLNQQLLNADYQASLVGRMCITNTNTGDSFLIKGEHAARYLSYQQLSSFGESGEYVAAHSGEFDSFKLELINSLIAHKIKSSDDIDYI